MLCSTFNLLYCGDINCSYVSANTLRLFALKSPVGSIVAISGSKTTFVVTSRSATCCKLCICSQSSGLLSAFTDPYHQLQDDPTMTSLEEIQPTSGDYIHRVPCMVFSGSSYIRCRTKHAWCFGSIVVHSLNLKAIDKIPMNDT